MSERRAYTKEDFAPFFKESAERTDGYIVLDDVVASVLREAPKMKVSQQILKKFAEKYASENGYKVGNPPVQDKSEKKQNQNEFSPSEPKYTFANVGGLENQKRQLLQLLIPAIHNSSLFKSVGVPPIRGILLHGPSGCGKTLFAEAAAGEVKENITFYRTSASSFFAVSNGQVESRIRSLFQTALQTSPSIVFIDDFDVLAKTNDNNSRLVIRQIC